MLAIADSDSDLQLFDSLDDSCVVDGFGSNVAVRTDEAARPQLDAAKVAGNNGDDIMELRHLQRLQDRDPCRPTRFPIVTLPLNLVLVPNEVCKAVVVGLSVGRLYFLDEVLGVFFTADPLE